MFEVLRENFDFELGEIVDDEASAIIAPADDGVKFGSLDLGGWYFEDVVGVPEKGRRILFSFHWRLFLNIWKSNRIYLI